MAEFEERKKFWHIFYSPLVFIILLAVFLLAARAMWKVYNYERASAQDRARLESELADVSKRQAVLKSQVDALETAQGQESEVRSKFNVVKAGEKVAVIVNDANATSATTTPAVEESWWQKLFGW